MRYPVGIGEIAAQCYLDGKQTGHHEERTRRMNRQYRAGHRMETLVIDDLDSNGYYTMRAGGSKGIADIIALKPGETLLVQVKGNGDTPNHVEWNTLYNTAFKLSLPIWPVTPLWVDKPKRGLIRYRQIVGRHTLHKHDWPALEWWPDKLHREQLAQ